MIKYTFYLTKSQLESLRLFDGTVSEHIRAAISKYIKAKPDYSPSKKGGKNGRVQPNTKTKKNYYELYSRN